ncbi:MAG: pyruvate dehydrogenase complex dihydrolipoamide acetyltransferase [Gemmatimonadaceae bacterium]
MATKIVMEALSPTMEEGRLVKWNRSEGDQVAKGDVLAEIETDKAVMDLVARGEGVLRKRLIEDGGTAPVGQLLGVIGTADEDISALVAQAPAAASPAQPAAPAASAPPAPALPAPPAPAAPAAPAKAAPPASAAPTAPAASAPPRATAPAPLATSVTPAAAQAPISGGNGERQRSSPLARRLASERGLDLQQLRGSGPGGRIIRRDIDAALAGGVAAVAPAAGAAAGAPGGAAIGRAPATPGQDFTDVPLTQIRKTIAKRLAESIGPIPTFYLTSEVDLTRVAEMREAMAAQGADVKVSYNDIILKAVATALAQHPEVNAHWLGDRIRQFNRVHVGMAVAIDEGLITPVIFDADMKGLLQIARESRELAERARARRLTPQEYTGSTFSVSNLGMFGIDQFTAIINPPEAGIIAVGAVEDKPVVLNGAVAVRKRLRLTMSCDHRVIDGALGARFLQGLRKMLENPLMMIAGS